MGEDSKGRIAELSQQLKNVRAQLKRTRSPMEEDTVCEPELCVKVVMVYVYSGHDLDAAAEFMVSHGHGKSKNLEERRCLVELAYRRTSTPIIVGLLTDACLEQHSFQVLVCTCRYVVELRLWQWLCKQNCEKGVAPSRLQLIRIALSAIPTEAPLQVQQRLRQPLSSSARSQRRWLHRFRRAWGARLGKLQVLHSVPQHMVEEKARVKGDCGVECRGEKGFPSILFQIRSILIYAFQLQFLSRSTSQTGFLWFLGPKVGPHFGVPKMDPKMGAA